MERVGSLNPNKHTIHAVIRALKAQSSVSAIDKLDLPVISKAELDSHANMVVLGNNCFIFESTGKTCNVEPFSSDLGIASNIPVVDAAIAYDCPSTYETYILIIRNALHMVKMNHHLIPPFIMREGGVVVNDVIKMHCTDPKINDHKK